MELEDIINLEKKIKEGYRVSQDEAFSIVNIAEKQEIYKLANRLREHFCGDYFDTCSIINAKSGRCSEDCKWCSQSKFHNCNITTYPLVSEKECLEMATNNHNKGVRRFSLVTSGRTLSDSEVQKAAKIYSALSKGTIYFG
ncbi:MAG: biotin synthase BioB, partial [Rikenellaceae bacterium]